MYVRFTGSPKWPFEMTTRSLGTTSSPSQVADDRRENITTTTATLHT